MSIERPEEATKPKHLGVVDRQDAIATNTYAYITKLNTCKSDIHNKPQLSN